MKISKRIGSLLVSSIALAAISLLAITLPASAQAPTGKPNILVIMGDDIGWMQPSIYHRGLMVGETPNIDRIGNDGALFMDYYAEASCTSGRNAFFTGMTPLRDGHDSSAVARQPILLAGRERRLSQNSCWTSAIILENLAKTTSATTPTRCRRHMGSRNTGATSITSTRCSR